MIEKFVEARTLPTAYHEALCELNYCGQVSDCADWNTRQKELAMTILIREPFSEPMISLLQIAGPESLQQYVMEMLDGILDFEVSRGKWAYTYHKRMVELDDPETSRCYFDQIEFVIGELKRNPGSRRAVIDIRTADDLVSNEPACLQNLQYFIREGRLDCVVLFRSNDACKATFENMFALIMLQKRIADELGVQVGTYTHRANSFHAYEKDWPMLAGYCNRILGSRTSTNTAHYEGDWKEQMEEAVPDILAKVEELKNR